MARRLAQASGDQALITPAVIFHVTVYTTIANVLCGVVRTLMVGVVLYGCITGLVSKRNEKRNVTKIIVRVFLCFFFKTV